MTDIKAKDKIQPNPDLPAATLEAGKLRKATGRGRTPTPYHDAAGEDS